MYFLGSLGYLIYHLSQFKLFTITRCIVFIYLLNCRCTCKKVNNIQIAVTLIRVINYSNFFH